MDNNTAVGVNRPFTSSLALSRSIVHWNLLKSLGISVPSKLYESLPSSAVKLMKTMNVYKTYSGFDRRVTALVWHPTYPNTVAVGSKGGDIILWNFEQDGGRPRAFIDGIGPGGSIQALIFDQRTNGHHIYSVSIDGCLMHRALFTNSVPEISCLLKSSCWNQWYSSLDINFCSKNMLVGDNKGRITLMNLDGEKQWEKKLHKQKVTHIEFSPSESWSFVSTSLDKSVKVWDIRNIRDKNSYVYSDEHEKPVNSAYFSRTNGGMLLTTDQHSEIRFYSFPGLILQRKVSHPHRQFQHLTPIKASWHPLIDVAVVGRYPEDQSQFCYEEEIRSIDFIDSRTGEMLHQHIDLSGTKYIMSLNLFNNQGDRLLSSAASHVYVWKPDFHPFQKKLQREGRLKTEDDDSSDDDDDCVGQKKRKRRRGAIIEFGITELNRKRRLAS